MSEKNHKKVIGVILAYKHASFLEKVYKSLPVGVYDEILVTNDESGDGIEVIAASLDIKCFSHPRLGYGGNLKYGIKKAVELGADYAVEIHGDGQFDVGVSRAAIEKACEGYDFVTGSRFIDIRQPLRDKMSLIRYIANIGLSAMARWATGVKLTEFHNGFRVYSKALITTVPLEKTSNDFLFAFEIIAWTKRKGLKISEIPIRCFYAHEHTSISIPRAIKFAFQSVGSMARYALVRMGFSVQPYA